ncbi:hypothetical protein CRYUN_Cryun39dG0085100 [Craigia yunnanensis]
MCCQEDPSNNSPHKRSLEMGKTAVVLGCLVVICCIGSRNSMQYRKAYFNVNSIWNFRNLVHIAETETERSENSDESEYGGSFINYYDLQFFPSSPESSDGSGSKEEMLDLEKSKDGKGRCRRLRKKYQLSESETDDSSQQKRECKYNDLLLASTKVDLEDVES